MRFWKNMNANALPNGFYTNDLPHRMFVEAGDIFCSWSFMGINSAPIMQ